MAETVRVFTGEILGVPSGEGEASIAFLLRKLIILK